MRYATVKECVLWAKDRLIDDFHYGMLHDNAANYAAAGDKLRGEFNDAASKFVRLLNLPDDSLGSLNELQDSGYWNGITDTYFENDVLPPKELTK